jgi:Transglycosylase-like domain
MKEHPLPRSRAEHAPRRIRIRLGSGALAGVLVAAIAAFVAGPAGAQQGGTDQGVAAAQARADQAGSVYLDALFRAQKVDQEVTVLEQGLTELEQRVAQLRENARGRAVEAYKRSGIPIAVQLGERATSMDSARRTVLLDLLTSKDDNAAAELRKSREALDGQRQQLKSAQQQHADLLSKLKDEEQRLNAELGAAQNERRRATAAPAASADAPLAPLTAYAPRAGEHPQHNDPWMVCTRRIESGGNYRAYNAGGPYYGAYQFTQSTWNSTANHAGRGELVGVDPRDASEYDQDDIAWTLYQWKGKGPWNGRC